ncbi:Alaserpin [Eumeta japonica]|uniref:Alaserpin n=1 Tax=Eumeta variegata TaxID=151549 RepID=A0A4C1W0X6_EUMVA|nr:Alaserpin [Eumeta japonica]
MSVAAGTNEDYQRQLRDGSVQFTNKYFSQVVKEKPNKSVVVSAFSLLLPLAQLSLASVGESHDELLNAMGLQNDNVTRDAVPAMFSLVKSVKGVDLKLASKMYVALNSQLRQQFETDTRQLFDSEIQKVDFAKQQETANAINTWVEEKTNQHIKDLVDADSIDETSRAVLVNAIYFKGSWKNKFNKDYTSEQDFHVSKDKTIKVQMMYRHGDFKYAYSTELDAELVEIPYEGDDVSFFIALPRKVEGLSDLQRKIKENPALLADAARGMHEINLDVHLPKFKIETETDLKEVLSKIGVTKIFDPAAARLDNLIEGDESLYVSKAVQKAYIEVNEEGAEAAAGNAFGIMLASLPPQFDANRPFMFALKVKSGPVLFSGVFRG